jgi:hypothetical protein
MGMRVTSDIRPDHGRGWVMLRSIRTYASSAGYRPGLVFKFSRPSPSNPANKGKRTTNSPIMRQVGSQIGKARNFERI